MRVVVVKWDRFSAEFISGLVRQEIDGPAVAVFHRADAALDDLRRVPADIGIFGLTLPDQDGLDLLCTVVRERLVAKRIVITWRTDERARHVLKGLEIHALVETLSQSPEDLAAALKSVAVGRASRLGSLGGGMRASKRLPLLDQILSKRELEVLAVLADGSDDATAAGVLGLRPNTVHTHRQRIMRKLDVQSRSALIREAMRRGVIRFTDFGALRPGLEEGLARREEPHC